MKSEVLIVVGAQATAVASHLASRGIPHRACTGAEALRDPGAGSRLVVDRSPGWEALVAGFAPRGAVVLLGTAPTAEEVRRKDEANFCDHFKPKSGAYVEKNTAEVERSRSALEDLFRK